MSIYDDTSRAGLAQRMDALMKGNMVRFSKAEDKRKIKSGEKDPCLILRHPDDHWKKATILELVTSMYGVGSSRARKWLKAEGIDAGAPIGSLTELQRYRLARHMEAAAQRARTRASMDTS